MKLIIECFMNKVTPDAAAPFGTRVLPEYERTSLVTYQNGGGWESLEAWRESVKSRLGFEGFDDQGRAKFQIGRSYGIHSYQLVSLGE